MVDANGANGVATPPAAAPAAGNIAITDVTNEIDLGGVTSLLGNDGLLGEMGEAGPVSTSGAAAPEPVVPSEPNAGPTPTPAAPVVPEPTAEPVVPTPVVPAEPVSVTPEGEPEVKFTPEMQAAFDKRVGQLTGKIKSGEEMLVAEQEKRRAAESKLAEAQDYVVRAQQSAVAASGIYPLLAAQSEAEINDREQKLISYRSVWRERRNGYEGTDEVKDPSRTADQVQKALDAWDDELRMQIPKAREAVQKRAAFAEYGQKHYPSLFVRGSAERSSADMLLTMLPGLASQPNALVLIGDMIEGEKLRKAKDAGSVTPAKPVPVAPVVPSSPAPAGASSAMRTPTKEDAGKVDVAKFVEDGGDHDALARQAELLIA
ncbi:hypothetical protein N9937_01555 [bacterium]|nr:hypothetical protein [bacterium]